MAEVRAGRVSDLADGQRILLDVDGREVFVFEREGRFYAFQNVCPHMGGPVGEGILMGKVEAEMLAQAAAYSAAHPEDES